MEVSVSHLDVIYFAKARTAHIVDTLNINEFKTCFKSILGGNESNQHLVLKR